MGMLPFELRRIWMPKIGYHASHEQFAPSELIKLVRTAENAGFDCAMSSDHFRRWGPAQGSRDIMARGCTSIDVVAVRRDLRARLQVPSRRACTGCSDIG